MVSWRMSSSAVCCALSFSILAMYWLTEAAHAQSRHSHDHALPAQLTETDVDGKCGHAHSTFASLTDTVSSSSYSTSYAQNAHLTDVLHYDVNLTMTVTPTPTIGGSVAMNIVSQSSALTEFFFRLHTAYNISKVELNGVVVAYERLNAPEVRAFWSTPIAHGAHATLKVFYSGTVPDAETSWFGGVKRNNGMMYSYTQPWNSHHWLAVKEPPGDYQDKSTADLVYTVPSALTVASNGSLLSETTNTGGTKTFHWKTTYPTAPYLLAFSVAPYIKSTKTFTYGDKSMPVELYLLPSMALPSGYSNWDSYLQLNKMIEIFSDKFGVYPFIEEKYGIAAWDSTVGGMEHQTISGQRKADSGTNGAPLGGQALTAHELAHQWFGNSITAKTLNDIWLNEGFATYLEVLWQEFKPGSTGRPAYIAGMKGKYPTDSVLTKLYVDNPNNLSVTFGQAQYRKGAYVLHMLRTLVGDDAFFLSLRTYLDRHAYQTVQTADLQAVFEEVSGRDLGYFFNQWVFQPGAPVFQYGFQQLTINGNKYVDVMVKQTQAASFLRFDVELPIRIQTSTGTQIALVNSKASQQNFLIPFEGTFSQLTIDPDELVLKGARVPSSVTYVAGGPKVLAASAEMHFRSEQPPSEIYFELSRGVTIPPGSVTLVPNSGQTLPLAFSYNPSNLRLTVQIPEGLTPDSYRVVVSDQVVDSLGKSLDGELPGSLVHNMWPSGDGVSGGAFEFPFVVEGALNACAQSDMDGNGVVDFGDITAALANYGLPYTPDPDDDGVISFNDVSMILACWGAL